MEPATLGDITWMRSIKMETETLVVLEEGAETPVEGPMACCTLTLIDIW